MMKLCNYKNIRNTFQRENAYGSKRSQGKTIVEKDKGKCDCKGWRMVRALTQFLRSVSFMLYQFKGLKSRFTNSYCINVSFVMIFLDTYHDIHSIIQPVNQNIKVTGIIHGRKIILISKVIESMNKLKILFFTLNSQPQLWNEKLYMMVNTKSDIGLFHKYKKIQT